jgi:hypothetical protein
LFHVKHNWFGGVRCARYRWGLTPRDTDYRIARDLTSAYGKPYRSNGRSVWGNPSHEWLALNNEIETGVYPLYLYPEQIFRVIERFDPGFEWSGNASAAMIRFPLHASTPKTSLCQALTRAYGPPTAASVYLDGTLTVYNARNAREQSYWVALSDKLSKNHGRPMRSPWKDWQL